MSTLKDLSYRTYRRLTLARAMMGIAATQNNPEMFRQSCETAADLEQEAAAEIFGDKIPDHETLAKFFDDLYTENQTGDKKKDLKK